MKPSIFCRMALVPARTLAVFAVITLAACSRQPAKELEKTAAPNPAASQTATTGWYFDFGPPPNQASIPAEVSGFVAKYFATRKLNGLVQPDWTAIHLWSDYSAKTGYGWTEKDTRLEWFYERDDSVNPLFHESEKVPLYDLLVDGLSSRKGVGSQAPFRVDVPPGKYVVTIYFGDLSFGEDRVDMSATVNGLPLFQGIGTKGGQVSVESRLVETKDPYLAVKFVIGKGAQIAVCGLAIEPAAPDAVASSTQKIPEAQPPAGTASKNLLKQITRDNEAIDAAWKSIREEGTIGAEFPASKEGHDRTRIFATMYGDPSRLANLDAALDVKPQADVLRRMGIDMVGVRNPAVAKTYTAEGLEVITAVHAEGFPPSKGQPVLQKFRAKNGSLSERAGFFSICAPNNLKAVAETWAVGTRDILPFVSGVFVDEPRGMSTIFGLGDYGPDSLVAFQSWVAANRPGSPAVVELPAPAFSQAFYDFFCFRLDAVPNFLSAVAQASGISALPLLPGNGEIGPESVNHGTFFPPTIAAKGMSVGSWNYLEPWQVKRSAEVVAAATREFGVPSAVYTSIGSDDVANRMQALAALSARPSIVGPREGNSFRLFIELSAMTQALEGAQHDSSIYLYWPKSLTYPDLVNYAVTEGQRWDSLAKELYDAALDFKVTYRAVLPAPSLLVYAPAQPVLSTDEVEDLRAFLSKGGVLVYASAKPILRPDGTPLGSLEEIFGADLQQRIVRMEKIPTPAELRSLAEKLGLPVNPPAAEPSLKSYAFTRNGRQLWMLLNTNPEQQGTITIPGKARDWFTKEKFEEGSDVPVKPGLFRLIEEQ